MRFLGPGACHSEHKRRNLCAKQASSAHGTLKIQVSVCKNLLMGNSSIVELPGLKNCNAASSLRKAWEQPDRPS